MRPALEANLVETVLCGLRRQREHRFSVVNAQLRYVDDVLGFCRLIQGNVT